MAAGYHGGHETKTQILAQLAVYQRRQMLADRDQARVLRPARSAPKTAALQVSQRAAVKANAPAPIWMTTGKRSTRFNTSSCRDGPDRPKALGLYCFVSTTC